MDLSAIALFPSVGDSVEGLTLPTSRPIWTLLDKTENSGIAKQLEMLLKVLGSSIPDEIKASQTITIDESKGFVHITKNASIGPCVLIEGPAYISGEVRHGALVRSHSWICEKAVVGHASEIKHSLLLPEAKAPHFNYVGDSILGSGVNLGAGCKLSNLRNDGRNIWIRGLGDPIDSELRKFGAILGENVQIGCNSVCNPGVILGAGCNVWPNITVSGAHETDSILRE
ncbi:MAG: hypothetical protein QF440_05950 [Candidatus Thalassarchaeaceae archaeon]|jgi:NDP-sugar pyrophosphorylase family protein|nr:hypothetical protein [Candidatus Thalassarchaeaceae archaeon]